MSEFRIFRGNGRTERTENESENVGDLLPFPPPRTPFSEWNQNLRVHSVHDQDPNPEKIGSLVLRNHLMECLPFANRGTGSNFSPKARGKPHSEPNSAQNTPNRNAGRPSFGGFVGGGRNNPHSGSKGGNLMNIQRGISNSTAASLGTDVPHFALEEDGSFWMDHNVQVLIRIRPISKMEKEMHGYNRCLKQESGQTLAWVGNPETRFTFDHIAGETVTQDLLFRVAGLPMVENCMSGYNSCTFAYGQTGSGKTYTMMGELYDSDDDLSEERGLTPRIFEYLFARIKAEEFSRKDEHLKYSCKCSFLEIYNEQITDLLEPSSTNLQLREDLKEGVYVESLRDFEVETVKDVMELLFQGTANRKVAATSMNSESSRSHSVFTCVIESRWEKDAMTHFRFARLNLVDLAGSERQKSSGAEGERLKEAANINKSLSTLGLVIMTLVDVAHGKNRHVPYRDSRLTFLLQDSLGGNSKTTIIANVSPSICCANETLSTLKFAQRAKLIRNNAKVNEDASGDVMALQRQIQQLKDQLTFLEHQRVARPIPVPSSSFCYDKVNSLHENNDGSPSRGNASSPIHDVATSVNCHSTLVSPSNLNKKLEAMLVGSLRREKMAEEALVQLKAEIEQMNRLCNEKEDDNRRINTILRLRDEKIARFELPAGDLQPADVFLMEENNALREEIQLLQARIDRNPELTRFALENIRLIEQLRMYQSFYENGEKEMLLAEVSLLRNQVLEIVERKHGQVSDSVKEVKDIKKNIAAGFETNTRLAREVQDLLTPMKADMNYKAPTIKTMESTCGKTDPYEEKLVCGHGDGIVLTNQKCWKGISLSSEFEELLNAKEDALLLLEASGDQQTLLFNRLNDLRQENKQHLHLSMVRECKDALCESPNRSCCEREGNYSERLVQIHKSSDRILDGESSHTLLCDENIEQMNENFQEVQKLNRCQSIQTSQPTDLHVVEPFCKKLEEPNAMVPNLQGTLAVLQQECDSKNDTLSTSTRSMMLLRAENEELKNILNLIMEENIRFSKVLEGREKDSAALVEWEKETNTLTNSLMDGYHAVEDASHQIKSICNLFPERRVQIDDQTKVTAAALHENERVILDLQRRLDSARDVGIRTSMELSALKEAVVAITDAQLMENVEMSKEAAESRNLHEKMHTIHKLEEKLKHQEDDLIMANRRANASFIALNWLLLQSKALEHNNEGSNTSKIMHEMGIPSENISKWIQSNELSEATSYIHSVTLHIADLEKEVHELRLALSSKENMTVGKTLKDESYAELEGNTFQAEVGCLIASCIEDIGNSVSFLASDVEDVICATRQWIQDLIEDVSDIKGIVTELKYCNVKIQDLRSAFSYLENPSSTGRNKRQTSYSLFEKQFMAISDQMTVRDEMRCHKNTELLNMKHSCAAQCVAERINEPQALLLKFSEAQETMREADMVLNALLQGYKTATHQVSKWKQKGQALTAENSTLLMQVQELKDSVLLKEEESKQLEEHFDMLITEVVGALSSFEHSMIQMRGASDEFNVLFSGFIAFVRELLLSVNVLRFCPESMIAAIGENTFAIFVLSHCFSDFLTGNAALHRTDSHRCYHTSRFELDGFEETFKLSAKEMRRPEGAHDAGNGAQENKLDALDAKDGMVIVGEDDQTSFRSKDDVVDDAKHRVDKNLSIYPPQYAIRIKELETEKEALVRDVQLMQEIVNHQLINLEEISQGLISLEKVSDCEKLIDGCAMGQMLKTNDATSVDLSCFHIINEVNSKSRMEVNHGSSLTPWNKSAKNQADCITQDESSVLVDFQNIKNQFTKLLDTLSKRKEGRHIILSQRSSNQNQGHDSHKFSRLCISANCLSSSELCRPLVQALVMLEAKLHPLADRIGSVGLGLDGTHYMLEKLFGDICKFERQTYIYEEKLSESDKQKNSLVSESFQLSSGLGRRDAVMEGLLFDLRLLQESTSNVKGRKDEAEEVSSTLRPTRNSHAVRATDIDGILNRQQRLQNYLTDKEAALESLQCDFVQTQEAMELLANENAELRILLDDLYQKKHDFEEQLVEQNEVIECLKKEVLSLSSTVEQKVINSVRDSEDQLKMVISERDLLLKEVAAISHQLEASLALAEENEAIAIEARQVSELSKIHAEQKEEEARVLEQSVEELEHTINMLEKKVYEMSSEVERQKLTREDLELEMQDLKLRLLKPQTVTGDMDNESSSNPEEGRDSIVLRHVEERGNELLEAKRCIQRLEKEKADQAEKYKSYISELLFHSEAQASQYQEKYKALEAMAFDAQHSIHLEDLAANRRERSSVRTRGSGSPFKCISSLVNQMNSEKDHELFVARTRMKELEGLAANRQKEVCVLNARLAIAESMTHDVIRDLLGVKLDLSTYVNELDDEVVQKLAEAVHKQSEEVRSKEQEILNLKSHLDDLIEERARLIEENNQKKCEVLDSQLRVEQLKQRQQLLTAQNELLQMDKQNLKKKVEEMDEVLKNCGSQDFHQLIHHQSKNKENRPLRIRNNELDQRHKDSEKRPSRVKDELPLNRFGRSGKSSAFNLDLQRRP